jgi:hypothetical protein
MAKSTAEKDWYRYCRIMLEWLHPARDLDPERWVEQVVARAASLNVNALAFDIYHGGYAIFNGAVAPKDRHVGEADVLSLLDRAVHERRMYLVAMNMGQHCAPYTAEEYPTWRRRDADGSPVKDVTSYSMCLNTPYADFLLQEFAGLLPRYRIDGIYIEGLYGQNWGNHCYCEYCCAEFERINGYPIPRDKETRTRDPRYAKFRADTITDFVRRLRNVINETSPQTVFMPSPSLFEGCYTDFAAWGEYADAVSLERQWGYERFTDKLFEQGMSMQVIRAESGRHPMGTTWLGWNVDQDYSPCTPEHYRLNFMEILLYGATPQLHAQTIFEVDQSEMKTVREMFDLVEKVRPTLLDAELVPYAALVVDWSDFNVSEHAKGFYQALIEHHVPFQVISKRDLRPDKLSRYKVLALPNVERLSDEELEAIRAFHGQGGGVVFTYRTGCVRPDGSLRPAFPLADIAGIKGPFGIVTNPVGPGIELLPHTYWRVSAEHAIGAGKAGRLQSFKGSWAEVEATTGQVIAEALDFDYSKMHRHHPVFGWYPGRPIAPLIVAQEGHGSGAGRVVCLAGEFDRATFHACLPGTLDTLAQAVIWAAGCRPPVEADCSPNVEMATHYSPSRKAYTLLMVNKATNDISPGWVVRHVETLRDITITLPGIGPAVKNVRSLIGSNVTWKAAGDDCVVTLERLREYDAVVVEE